MRLESLKIYGFKSFADEAKFDFDAGMTVIVGPNGCGKSNVLDAINWALGEQSASRLRGDKMEDMIFTGSKTRKPIGVSSVEFCIDNSSGILPLDYDKVTVMRKLYRSGDSEYYINRSPCRLKDIKELFMDTGVGTQSYSVMDQGDVSFILKCSPEERRGIIEEAAGIRKYKERKENAKRRLDRTKRDLDEVKNIMAEVKKNIRRLKRQSAKARQFRKYSERLSYLEVSRLCREYISINERLQKQLSETVGIQDKLASLSSVKSKIDARVSKMEEKKSELDETIINLSQSAYQIESKIEIINNSIENFDSELKRLDEEIKRNEEAKSYSEKSLKQLNEELDDLDSARDTETEKELKNIQEEIGEKKADIKTKEKQFHSLQKKIIEMEKEIVTASSRCIDLSAKTENILSRENNLSEKSEALKKTYNELFQKLEVKNENIGVLEKKIAGYISTNNELYEYLGKSNEKIAEIEKDREKILRDYHQTSSEFESGKKYLPQLLSIEKLASRKIKGIDGPLFAVLEKYFSQDEMKKIAAMAGEKMSWMTAADMKAAEQAVSFLRENNLPPLTFVLADKIPPLSSGIALSGNADGAVKKLVSFITASSHKKGDLVFYSDCVVSGGGEMPLRSGRLLVLEKDIERLRHLLKETESILGDEKEKKDTFEKEVKKNRESLEKMSEELSVLKQERSNLKGRVEFISGELKVISRDIENLPDKVKIEEEIIRNNENAENLQSELVLKKSGLTDIAEALDDLKTTAAAQEARHKILSDSTGRITGRLESVEERISETQKEMERLNRLVEDLKANRVNIISRNSSDIDKLGELKEEKKKIQNRTGELQNEKGGLASELKKLKEEQKEKDIDLQRCKDEAAGERQTEEVLREKLSGIKVRITEDMNTDLETAMENYSGEEIDAEEIRTLKNKLEKIGNVNLQAPEEFEKENQRFEFIKRHVDDLEEADRNLRSIIRKINTQTKDRFLDTFNEVNKNFHNVFNRLFEGGQASLSLLDPENILESGIEMKARPEGKKITSLKQLSGGERALLAIAFMFAVFEVKPSPFCILDEVDAPLDEINLHRFLKMLKDYSENTQFILITHNKQTMQQSDTFYGITMEEFGVSKVISVNLKDAKSVPGE